MIHYSQLKISPIRTFNEGGQKVGVQLPSVEMIHVPSGCSVIIKDGRSQGEVRRLAEEALEYVLLGLRWHAADLEREIEIPALAKGTNQKGS